MVATLLLWAFAILVLLADLAGLLWPRWLARMPRIVELWRHEPDLLRSFEGLAKLIPLLFAGWLIAAGLFTFTYLTGQVLMPPLLFGSLVLGSVLMPLSFRSFVRGTSRLLRGGDGGTTA